MLMGGMMLRTFLKKLPKVAFLFLAMAAILYSHVYAEEVIRIGGAGSTLGSMKLLAAAFEKKHPGTKVIVLPSIGSIGGIAAVSRGGVDIGLLGRPLNDKERKLGLSVIEYARTPLVFITKENINVSNLSTQEIIKILRGDTKTWPSGERIRLILRQPTESNAISVREISPEMSEAMDIAMSRPWKVIALTDQETTSLVEKTPGAFSFCSLAQLVFEKRKIRALAYNGINPISKNSANDLYPIVKTHAMLIKPNPSPKIKQFINFVKSSEGKKILEESGNSVP
jgi:phosphate transport system substrate-binding protein